MVIPAALYGGIADQHTFCKDSVMSNIIETGSMDEDTVSEVVELGDVMEETKGGVIGASYDPVGASRWQV